VTFDPTARFAYVVNRDSNDVTTFSIDQSTGALTAVGTAVAAGGAPGSIVTVGGLQEFAVLRRPGLSCPRASAPPNLVL